MLLHSSLFQHYRSSWPFPALQCHEDTHSAVVSNTRGFPSPVIPTGVTLIELKAVVLIPANVQQRHTKGTLSFNKEKKINNLNLKTSHLNLELPVDVAQACR